MATLNLLKKVPAGPLGNFNYTYECACGAGAKHTITISAANDLEAKKLAEQDCEEKCGE